MDIISIIKAKKNFHSLEQISDEKIKEKEKELGLKINEDYKKCIKEFGIFSFDGHEFVGVSSSKRLDIVNVTIKNKNRITETKDDLYVIEELNIDGIVIWQNTKGQIFQSNLSGSFKKIAESFNEYIG